VSGFRHPDARTGSKAELADAGDGGVMPRHGVANVTEASTRRISFSKVGCVAEGEL
jgi:hypothetical protein